MGFVVIKSNLPQLYEQLLKKHIDETDTEVRQRFYDACDTRIGPTVYVKIEQNTGALSLCSCQISYIEIEACFENKKHSSFSMIQQGVLMKEI